MSPDLAAQLAALERQLAAAAPQEIPGLVGELERIGAPALQNRPRGRPGVKPPCPPHRYRVRPPASQSSRPAGRKSADRKKILAHVGITEKEASRFMRVVATPQSELEAIMQRLRRTGTGEITTEAVLRQARRIRRDERGGQPSRGRGKARRSLELIEASIEILREIQPATVRAVCYRLFTLGLIASMSKNDANRVGRQLVDAREHGWIPWGWIVDETRTVESVSTWADPEGFADVVTQSYRRNKWQAQPARLEVWSEKGTVRGTLAPVLDQYEVPFRVMHGFASATTVQEIASASLRTGQPLIALYAGDWDPSGLHMSEQDLPERLHAYRVNLCEQSKIAWWHDERFEQTHITIDRVALALKDIATPALPSFPLDTKRGDPRHDWYRGQGYGARCWELDALSPVTLRERVQRAIVARLDQTTWDRYARAEQLERASIVETCRSWRRLAVEPA